MERVAVFPGSFDPITRGHENIILRALSLFDRIIIAVGENAEKQSVFPIDRRVGWIREVFNNEPRIEVEKYSGLTVEFCNKRGIRFILRGLRTSADFEFERTIGQVNKRLDQEIETVFFLTAPEYTALNSSIVRDILKHGGDVTQFVPENVKF